MMKPYSFTFSYLISMHKQLLPLVAESSSRWGGVGRGTERGRERDTRETRGRGRERERERERGKREKRDIPHPGISSFFFLLDILVDLHRAEERNP